MKLEKKWEKELTKDSLTMVMCRFFNEDEKILRRVGGKM